MRHIWWLPAAVALVLTACGSAGAPPACASSAADVAGTVTAFFESNVGAIRRLEAVSNNAQLGAYPEDDPATVCYIDGDWPKSPPSPSSGTAPAFNRGVVVVVHDEAYVIALGYRDALPIAAP